MSDSDLADTWSRLAAREVHGIAAVLLPYRDGAIDWPAFEAHLVRTRDAGLDAAVNMDTGFGDLLSPDERALVLDATRRALGPDVPFYAGAYADADPDPVEGWRTSVGAIVARGGRPVLVQFAQLHGLGAAEKAGLYAKAVTGLEDGALAFELSPVFAPHGEIWDDETFRRVLEIPGIRGAKHSSLDRQTELRRLRARDAQRPDFRVYTGNDLAIDMIAYGSDYLLGLATFAPDRFAERDAALAAARTDFLARNDALQHLGNVGFRTPVPAYKHAAAQFLHLTGRLDGCEIHPRAPRRPASERILLHDCATRLGLLDDPERAFDEKVAPYL